MVVDLPAPFGPRNAVTTPGSTTKLSRSTTVLSPYRLGEMTRLLHEHGFGQIAALAPDEPRAAYFRGQADVEIAGAQRLVAATVAPASALSGLSTGQPA